jgi:microsomal dipeptidase-like Zn-dependent dipeptidase
MSRSTETIRALREVDKELPPMTDIEKAELAAVEAALSTPTQPVNTTHSNALAGMLLAHERQLKEKVADIDSKIAELNAERTDAMLAESGVSAALRALQNNK